jgi:glutamate/tyrosine decarboxylase-like PLP-dependent enzyme
MIGKIKALELIAKELEPDSNARKHIRKQVINQTEKFLEEIDSSNAFDNSSMKSDTVSKEEISEEPTSIEKLVQTVSVQLDQDGINPASGNHLGYIPGGGIYASSLGDYWTDITNRYAGVYFANPGAVRMENRLIRWMISEMGYPESALGNLASGGSIANLTAIVTAREHHKVTVDKVKKSVIYLSEQAHHCIIKAIKIAGLSEAHIRYIGIDEQSRIKTQHLIKMINADISNGLSPFLLVGSAGTTDTGAIDPLQELSEISKQYGLWYHIDGAYGAFFRLTEEGKEKLKGIENSDSLVLDPHKSLFIPYGLGVVLVKNGNALKKAFSESANYLQDLIEIDDEVSPADVSPELTKPFRGLRLWLPLKLHGLRPFRAALDEKLLLAKYAYQKLNEMKGFHTGQFPQLSVVTFWYEPTSGDINQFNEDLVKEIHRDGRVFLSSTKIKGRFTLRLAILVFRTHLDTIDLALTILQEKAAYLEKELNK